jgi:hypothetical protein
MAYMKEKEEHAAAIISGYVMLVTYRGVKMAVACPYGGAAYAATGRQWRRRGVIVAWRLGVVMAKKRKADRRLGVAYRRWQSVKIMWRRRGVAVAATQSVTSNGRRDDISKRWKIIAWRAHLSEGAL